MVTTRSCIARKQKRKSARKQPSRTVQKRNAAVGVRRTIGCQTEEVRDHVDCAGERGCGAKMSRWLEIIACVCTCLSAPDTEEQFVPAAMRIAFDMCLAAYHASKPADKRAMDSTEVLAATERDLATFRFVTLFPPTGATISVFAGGVWNYATVLGIDEDERVVHVHPHGFPDSVVHTHSLPFTDWYQRTRQVLDASGLQCLDICN